jgi:sulfoxide reductase catalytic subunit YedY
LWAIPIGAAAVVLLIALAQSLREFPSVQVFIKEYPGIAHAAPSVDSGFPWWLQLQHFTPGTEWFRFQHLVPEGRIWTSKDDSGTCGEIKTARD